MVIFKSPHPDIDYPTNITTWQWAFEPSVSRYSPLQPDHPRHAINQSLGSYANAVTKESLDFATVKQHATNLSNALAINYDIKAGDTVSLFSTNTIWYPVAMWAVSRLGGRVNGASPAYTVEEMVHAIKTAKTKVLMTLPIAVDSAVKAADAAGIPRDRILLLEGSVSGFQSIQDLISSGSHLPTVPYWHIPSGQTNKSVCGYLNFSSGTTGLPKAVMLSHHNIIAQCLQLQQLQTIPDDKRYSILAVMPLFHITGLVRFCTYPILMNGNCYMLPSYTLEGMLDAIVTYRIEELILVPPILIRLVRDPIVDAYMPDIRCVKRWSSGSAPIAPEVIKALQAKFPWTGFRQGYGATESTACISCHPPSHFDYKYATTGGMLVANTVAKVVSLDDGRVLGTGETGEICAKGPQIAMGYLDNPGATEESFKEGWLHTGDVGHFDEEGLVHVEDRIKEMIKVKGLQVPPAELEDLLLGHPLVEDVAVTGVPDMFAGERPKAFVILRQDAPVSDATGRSLLDYVKENKVRYKWIVEIEFVDEVPKSPTGKLLRRILKLKEKEGKSRGLKVREPERAKL